MVCETQLRQKKTIRRHLQRSARGQVEAAGTRLRQNRRRMGMSNTRATAADSASLDTFPRLLMHHAQQRPTRPAMREKEYGIWQTYTWAEVADKVRAIASGLAELGFKRGDRLAVVGDNRPRQ